MRPPDPVYRRASRNDAAAVGWRRVPLGGTIAGGAAPYCEACGYQFAKGHAVPSSAGRKVLLLVIVTVMAIALVVSVRNC